MITFRVAKEPCGWAVQMDQHMTTPFRTLDLAVREANALAGALRAHGQLTEVIVDNKPSARVAVPAHVAASTLKATYQAR